MKKAEERGGEEGEGGRVEGEGEGGGEERERGKKGERRKEILKVNLIIRNYNISSPHRVSMI